MKTEKNTMWWWGQRLQLCSCQPRSAKDCQQATRSQEEGRSPPQGLEKAGSFQRLELGLPELWENTVLFYGTQFVAFCYRSPRKQICLLWFLTHRYRDNKSLLFIFRVIKKILCNHWRRKWQPIPVFLPGKSHGQRSLAGYSPRGPKESDTT